VKSLLELKLTPVRSGGYIIADNLAVIDLVQQGISEKVALSVNFLSAFITGFALAYARSWRLALALTSIFPCIVVAGGMLGKVVSKHHQYVLTSLDDTIFQ
jgi:ABC-type multidrug transport system fused ATPase/permease subunit